MKKILTVILFFAVCPLSSMLYAQGWPENYSGVMMQAFSWDDYDNTRWAEMESQTDELANFFTLIWIPQSGNCGGKSMGYNPLYYYDHDSSFGTEAELRSMIKTFKAKGISTIADVVINHRSTLSGWFDFPVETYNGQTYTMFSTDVCADDDGGKAKAEADRLGVSLSPNKDSGEGWDGFRDIDHASENVQQNIFAYEDFLLNNLGYTGFRYDVAKGFEAKYFGMYNAQADVAFSVGEYWDGNAPAVRKWIDGTKVDGVIRSGAFDFPFRYRVRDAFSSSGKKFAVFSDEDFLAKTKSHRRYAVTFVENHDTQDRRPVGGPVQDPLTEANVPASNAVLLAMPGTPCIFQPHWLNYKKDIKKMILARQAAGIVNTSDYTVHEASTDRFMVECGDLLCIVGKSNNAKAVELGFTLVTNGNKYYYYLRNSLEMVFISEPSGVFDAGKTSQITVELTALTTDNDAKIVYTLDGSEPNKDSQSGKEVKISENTTLKVGMLMSDGTVKDVQTRTYTFVAPEPFEEHDATVYVKADFSPVYFYIWDSNNNSQLNGNWPGKQMDNVESNYVTIDGEQWLKQTVHIGTPDYYFNIIFNNNDGKQTTDITRVKSDRYFIATLTDSKISYKDVTNEYTTSIEDVKSDYDTFGRSGVHSIDGRVIKRNVSSDDNIVNLPSGIYIINGKKVIKQ